VAANAQEREEAWNNAPSPEDGSLTNRAYMLKMEREGRTQDLAFKREQLAEQIAGRPLREQATRAGIAASNASTKAQTQQTASLEREERIKQLTAVAMAPTQEQLKTLAPNLASEVNAGNITPQEAASVIANVKNTEAQRALQQQLVNNANPEYQRKLTQTYAAQDKAKDFASALRLIKSAGTAEGATRFTDDDSAKRQAAKALRMMGLDEEADEILKSYGNPFAGQGFLTSTRLRAAMNRARVQALSQFDNNEAKQIPEVQALLTDLNSINADAQSKPNLVAPRPAMNAGGMPTPQPGMPQPLPSRNARKRVAPAANGGPK
jgi:hypothetical protein